MLCRSRKIVFVHIPKTGGSSVENMLWPNPRREADLWMGFVAPGRNRYQTGGLQHLTATQIRQEIGAELFAACYVFSFVRHPVDRLVSQFNFLNRRADLLEMLELGRDRSFEGYLDRIRSVEHVQWMAQARFLLDDHDRVAADIFRLEEIEGTFPMLSERLGMDADRLPHANRSLPATIPPGWVTMSRDRVSDEAREMIEDRYAGDYELLGYGA